MKTSILSIILISFSFLFCSSNKHYEDNAFWPSEKSPESIGDKVIKELLSRKDFMMYQNETVKCIHYAEACAAFGAARFAGLIGDTATLNKLEERYALDVVNKIGNTANHVDANVYGILPLEFYTCSGNEDFLKQGLELADSQWENPTPEGLTNQTRFWIDDIYMIGSLQVQAYRATGDEKYLDRAALEIDTYFRKLQQPNGLFHHGEVSHFFWGRGNGWVAAGVAELLSELPESNPYYNSILEGYQKMMYALAEYQADDGMWRQLVDRPESWKETSSTAMFGFAITLGVKKGLLPAEEFTPVYQKAWLALTDYVDDEGKLGEVCVGTWQANDYQFYIDRPRVAGDFHGQAPLLWFAWSLLLDEETES
jgi:unsaturated rhamnogalacturonyl hydrolase